MAYDLKNVKAPRLAGPMFRFVARLSESSAVGPLLARKLLRDVGVTTLRATPASEPLPLAPPRLPHGAGPDAPPGAGAPPTPTAALLAAAEALPGAPAGFPLETVSDFVAAYRAGRSDPARVAEAVLAAVAESDAHDPPLRLFIAQDPDDLRAQAAASAERWRRGAPLSPLDGVPVPVKDELDQAPYPTTVGTSFLGRLPAGHDAEVVARLRSAGALLVGKTNMHEIGLGVSGINPHHGACRNPYDPQRMTGGSSSGPAAAVGAGIGPIAVGADGGGSIRIPAGLCGVVGLKGTFGRFSEHGAFPLCWSLAHVGPIAASVRDVALAYAVMAGPHADDPNTLGQPPVRIEGLPADGGLAGLRLGVYRPWFEHAEPGVVRVCDGLLAKLREAGAAVVEIEIPELELLRVVHLVTIVSEMLSSMSRHAAHRREHGPETRLNLSLARFLTSADYVSAQRHRLRLCGHFARALRAVDAIVTPATGRTAPPIRPDAVRCGESDMGLTMDVMRFAPAANVTGLPGVSFPAGYDEDGLPVGLQVMGRPWEEHVLLRVAAVAERLVERRAPRFHRRLLGA
jgi:Asp-tRNA(Asn)/Glu-tRNA(Gln) amidotransferase A subunit family amidase